MKVLYAPNYEVKEESVVSFGKFDGLHKGHVELLNTLLKEAKKDDLCSVVYTFINHPKSVLDNVEVKLLMDNEAKINKLESMGVDFLVFEEFSKAYADITPEEFVKDILIDKLNMKKVVIGSNSTFGKSSEGNVELLKVLADKYNFEVVEIPLLKENGRVISSSEIRKQRFQEIGSI